MSTTPADLRAAAEHTKRFGISGFATIENVNAICDHILATVHADDAELDGTDAAHPAYWRGTDAGFASMCQQVSELLDGKSSTGVCAEPWNSLRHRIAALVQVHADDEPVTVEVYKSLGFKDYGAYLRKERDDGATMTVYRTGWLAFNDCSLVKTPTIGQLRHLLAGLQMGGGE